MAKLTIAAVILVLAATMSLTEAQNTSTSCVSTLTPCAGDLNFNTTPSVDCCNGIRYAVYNELNCACSLYNNPDLLKPLNISLSAALQIARNCTYVCTFLINCTKALSPTECVYPPPAPGQADRILWTGVTSLLLFLAFAVLY